MLAVNVKDLELMEGWAEADPTQRGRFDFPIHVGNGAAASSIVYFEVNPGENCGRHTHSAEEIVYLAEGEAEVEVSGERVRALEGGLVLIPTMAPHNVYNVGAGPVRVVGFFAAAAVITIMENEISPIGAKELIIGSQPAPAAASVG